MVLSEGTRRAVRSRLTQVLGEEVADVLMDHMPPVDWSALATKKDVETSAVALKKDIEALAVSTKKDLEVLESRLRTEMASLRAEFVDKLSSQTRTFTASQIVLVLAVIGSVTGAVATLAH